MTNKPDYLYESPTDQPKFYVSNAYIRQLEALEDVMKVGATTIIDDTTSKATQREIATFLRQGIAYKFQFTPRDDETIQIEIIGAREMSQDYSSALDLLLTTAQHERLLTLGLIVYFD